MRQPSPVAALYFTVTAGAAVFEMLYTGLRLPYPWFPAVLGIAACLLSSLAAAEWTALRHRRNVATPVATRRPDGHDAHAGRRRS